MKRALLAAGAVGQGLLGGIYLGFAIGVMPALAALDSDVFVDTMNQISVAIVNPLFLAVFALTPISLLLGLILVRRRRAWTIAALALGVAAVAVTAFVNVPLNDALTQAGNADADAARTAFEIPWNIANVSRTVLSVLSSIAAACALLAPNAPTVPDPSTGRPAPVAPAH